MHRCMQNRDKSRPPQALGMFLRNLCCKPVHFAAHKPYRLKQTSVFKMFNTEFQTASRPLRPYPGIYGRFQASDAFLPVFIVQQQTWGETDNVAACY